jgi:hypothetical protein
MHFELAKDSISQYFQDIISGVLILYEFLCDELNGRRLRRLTQNLKNIKNRFNANGFGRLISYGRASMRCRMGVIQLGNNNVY